MHAFSTVEVVLALALSSLMFGSIISISSSNQNVVIDTAQSNEAVMKATELIEEMRAYGTRDFRLVRDIVPIIDGMYEKRIFVKTLLDYITKEVTVEIRWQNIPGRNQKISLTSLLIDTDIWRTQTCGDTLSGNWSLPYRANAVTSFAQLIGDPTGKYPITDLDVYQQKLFVTVNNSSSNKPTLFIFDVSNQAFPVLLKSIDNDGANNTGINGIVIGKSQTGVHAFLANASSFVKGQLQIIDTSPPYNIVTYKISSTIVKGSSTQGTGNVIFYANGFVYLGLKKTIAGPEFNIVDVRDPQNPFWVGGYTVGNGINSIVVKGKYAYIASPNNQELITLDISDPANPYYVGGYDAPDTVGNGKSIDLIGDTLYLGRTVTASNPELVVLNNTAPNSMLPPLGSKEISSSVNGLFIRDFLAFILTNSELKIFSTQNPQSITAFASPFPLPASGGSPAPSFDCEENALYIGSNDSQDKGYVSIITAP